MYLSIYSMQFGNQLTKAMNNKRRGRNLWLLTSKRSRIESNQILSIIVSD